MGVGDQRFTLGEEPR